MLGLGKDKTIQDIRGAKVQYVIFFLHTVNLITVEKVKIMIKQLHRGNTSLLPRGALGALDG